MSVSSVVTVDVLTASDHWLKCTVEMFVNLWIWQTEQQLRPQGLGLVQVLYIHIFVQFKFYISFFCMSLLVQFVSFQNVRLFSLVRFPSLVITPTNLAKCVTYEKQHACSNAS